MKPQRFKVMPFTSRGVCKLTFIFPEIVESDETERALLSRAMFMLPVGMVSKCGLKMQVDFLPGC